MVRIVSFAALLTVTNFDLCAFYHIL